MNNNAFFLSLRNKPFIIAEMSGNHNQSLNRALTIVEAAAKAGAHGLKLQTYTADTMTLPLRTADFLVKDAKSEWNGRSLYDLYSEAYTPWEWHEPIARRCQELGMMFFSTPFDPTAIEFLERLNVPFYKIASFELTDLGLISMVARTGKPIIMSCGMASEREIEEAVAVARRNGAGHLALLKCTSSYPASPENSNLMTIPDMKKKFETEIGLSDHTLGIGVALASIALGATVIEKHFTLARKDGGIDSAFSLEPDELKTLVQESERAWQGLGRVHYGATSQDCGSLDYRRSVYASANIRKGETFTKDNIRVIRPGFGLPPARYDDVLGRQAARDISFGMPLKEEYLSPRKSDS